MKNGDLKNEFEPCLSNVGEKALTKSFETKSYIKEALLIFAKADLL